MNVLSSFRVGFYLFFYHLMGRRVVCFFPVYLPNIHSKCTEINKNSLCILTYQNVASTKHPLFLPINSSYTYVISLYLPEDASTLVASACVRCPWQRLMGSWNLCTTDRVLLPVESRSQNLPGWTGSPRAFQTDQGHSARMYPQTSEVLKG